MPPGTLIGETKMLAKYSKVAEAFRSIDSDHDRSISWTELKQVLHNFNLNTDDPDIRALFKSADRDGSDALEFDEQGM